METVEAKRNLQPPRRGKKPGRKPLSRLNVYRVGPVLMVEDDVNWLQAYARRRRTTVSAIIREWLGAARDIDDREQAALRQAR